MFRAWQSNYGFSYKCVSIWFYVLQRATDLCIELRIGTKRLKNKASLSVRRTKTIKKIHIWNSYFTAVWYASNHKLFSFETEWEGRMWWLISQKQIFQFSISPVPRETASTQKDLYHLAHWREKWSPYGACLLTANRISLYKWSI
jgi:hypothetical protein